MKSTLKSKFLAIAMGVALAAGSAVVVAAPAQAASASCSSLSYNYHDISGNCKAATGNSSVTLGYSCWGTGIARSISVSVGTGRSFTVNVGQGCGIFGITGVWLIG